MAGPIRTSNVSDNDIIAIQARMDSREAAKDTKVLTDLLNALANSAGKNGKEAFALLSNAVENVAISQEKWKRSLVELRNTGMFDNDAMKAGILRLKEMQIELGRVRQAMLDLQDDPGVLKKGQIAALIGGGDKDDKTVKGTNLVKRSAELQKYNQEVMRLTSSVAELEKQLAQAVAQNMAMGKSVNTNTAATQLASVQVKGFSQSLAQNHKALIGIGFASMFASRELQPVASAITQIGFFGFNKASYIAAGISAGIGFLAMGIKALVERGEELRKEWDKQEKAFTKLDDAIKAGTLSLSQLSSVYNDFIHLEPFVSVNSDEVISETREALEKVLQLRQKILGSDNPNEDSAPEAYYDALARADREAAKLVERLDTGVFREHFRQYLDGVNQVLDEGSVNMNKYDKAAEKLAGTIRVITAQFNVINSLGRFGKTFRDGAREMADALSDAREEVDRLRDAADRLRKAENEKAVKKWNDALVELSEIGLDKTLDKYEKLQKQALDAAEEMARGASSWYELAQAVSAYESALTNIERSRAQDQAKKDAEDLAKAIKEANTKYDEASRILAQMFAMVSKREENPFDRMKISIEEMISAFARDGGPSVLVASLREAYEALIPRINELRDAAADEAFDAAAEALQNKLNPQLDVLNNLAGRSASQFDNMRLRADAAIEAIENMGVALMDANAAWEVYFEAQKNIDKLEKQKAGEKFNTAREKLEAIANLDSTDKYGRMREQIKRIQEDALRDSSGDPLAKIIIDQTAAIAIERVDKLRELDIGTKIGDSIGKTLIDGIISGLKGGEIDMAKAMQNLFFNAIGDVLQEIWHTQVTKNIAGAIGSIIPSFDSGGPVTRDQIAMVHKGEYVLSKDNIKAMGRGTTVIIQNNAEPSSIWAKGFNGDSVRHVIRNDMFTDGPIRKFIRRGL